MASDRKHLILNNPKGQKNHFDARRGFTEPEIEEKPASAYRPQKDRFQSSLRTFARTRTLRREQQTLEVPTHLEYIEIKFFSIFNDNNKFKTKARFKNQYGLIPVNYSDFNKTVIFQISDEPKFAVFAKLLNEFITSPDTVHPLRQQYALATIIYDFAYLSSKKILSAYGSDVVMSFVKKDPEIAKDFDEILGNLKQFLSSLKAEKNIEFATDENSLLQIKNILREDLNTIVNNFDIFSKVNSLRVPTIKPNTFNVPELTWNFKAIPPDNDIFIGILDNGVKPIDPIANILIESDIDITNPSQPDPFRVEHHHGTIVATLAALGTSFFDTSENNIQASAWIFPIKILNFSKGHFNIFDIQAAIMEAYKQGVRIFNLSVCGPTKSYNEEISQYAYILDYLTYELDILIFIATGNLEMDDIIAMKDNPNKLHNYPNHFYNPNTGSEHHNCEAMNICIPSESHNNITVGAIAENLRPGTTTDISLDKELPAYYSRKHYLDYSKKINGTDFSDSQKNYNINKPDILMPGGDMLNDQSAMQVPGLGINGNDYYLFESGTSLATPLATNLSAKILTLYPSLRLQSVKALMLNSAKMRYSNTFLTELIDKIRNEEARTRFGKKYSSLSSKQSKKINSIISPAILYRHLIGEGVPSMENLLYSNNKSLTALIEDSLPIDTYKVINLNIPKYLVQFSKASAILNIKGTICFKFSPVWSDALNYNPLHISFNIANSVERNNPSKTAEIISDREHPFFNKFYTPGMSTIKKAAARSKALGVKSTFKAWSDDFYPRSSKPFSNTSNFELDISKPDILKVKFQVSIVVRCTIKPDLDREILQFLKSRSHDFSIALTITEKENTELSKFSLYDEFIDINEFLEIEDLTLEDDLELYEE